MSQWIWIVDKDGWSRIAIDLHDCRFWSLQSYSPEEYIDGYSYYFHNKLNFWICCIESFDYENQLHEVSYRRDDPVTAAANFQQMAGRYPDVLGVSAKEALNQKPTPIWDPQRRELKLTGKSILRYNRTAPNQFNIFETFESQKWPPFLPREKFEADPTTLRQDIKNLMRKKQIHATSTSPSILFRYAKAQVSWSLKDG